MAENYSLSPYCTIADPARTPMPRQEILSPGQHAQLLMLPTDARQIAECYTFSPADLDLIAQCRGEPEPFGLRGPTRLPPLPGPRLDACGIDPRAHAAAIIAGQLGVTPDDFAGYASRDQTRREHLARLVATFGWRTFGLQEHREVSAWLLTLARGTDRGLALVKAAPGGASAATHPGPGPLRARPPGFGRATSGPPRGIPGIDRRPQSRAARPAG